MTTNTPQKILFYRFDTCLGDSVVHTFVVRELKKLFPRAHLTLVTFAPNHLFWKNNPYVDELLVLPVLGPVDQKFRYLRLPVLYGLVKALWHAYTGKYDRVIINLTRPTRNNTFYARLLPHTTWVTFDYSRHIIHSYEKLLCGLGAREIDTSYELPLTTSHRERAQQFLQQHNLQQNRFWVLNPIGADKRRQLNTTQIHALLNQFKQAGIPVVVLDYKNQFPELETSTVRCMSRDILDTASVIELAAGVVTVDTGIVHVADALKKPMLVIYAKEVTPPHSFWKSLQPTTQFVQGENDINQIPVSVLTNALQKMWK
ncbi:MAG: glycosyltransferase family 9 protein [Elusimicrobiaceae bacterium]|nr:glycosyltransferase family 9 protein [Elusimicrobiaceae bacterium]